VQHARHEKKIMDRRNFLKNTTMLAGVVAPRRLLKPFSAQGKGLENQTGAPDEGGGVLDLSSAVVVVSQTLPRRERKAIQVLVEEIERRTRIRLPVRETWPASSAAKIVIGTPDSLRKLGGPLPADIFGGGAMATETSREGYTLRAWNAQPPSVAVAGVAVVGADERGVLFGVGGLLRSLRMRKNEIAVDGHLNLTTHPKYSLRGLQLGYRPKTNSYDGWTVDMWDQYIRDLAVFGANSVELIPPRSDDELGGPNFWLPPKRMMVEMSRICDDYGLDVWIWYPAMQKDYSDPKTVEAALNEWGEIFKALPRIDAVFVPGGDPGHSQPNVLLALLEKQHQNLRQYHPRAATWISPQSFDRQWMEEFFAILERDQPKWLGGVVFGPQIYLDLPAFRQRIPKQYPIRFYPDITHSLECQFPVPDWDTAYAYTEGREVINPRPADYADIMRLYLPYTSGFIAYSEGCNDDVNAFVCASMAWNPEAKVIGVLREYSRYFIGDQFTEGFAQGLLALERNWRAPLISNQGVMTTLQQFQTIEAEASPHDLLAWRLQQALYRAYYDAYVRSRLLYETVLERQAMDILEEVRRPGVQPLPPGIGDTHGVPTNALDLPAVLAEASAILEKAYTAPVSQDWRTRVLELGEALYQSIRMQMAVELYKAEAVNRGATLDTLDAAISNLPWLLRRIREIRALPSDERRINAILEILDRTNPGPGGFYDDLGNVAQEPHLIRGLGAGRDPEFRHSALDEFAYPDRMGGLVPVTWKRWAGSLYDEPLELHYPNLDPSAEYRLRVVYAGNAMNKRIRLAANKGIEIHNYIQKPWPIRPLEFDIPSQAVAAGELRLSWFGEPGLGHNGQGCQVAEVWLMKK
ncbi:MAG: hypothetical protein ACRD18_10800, partial [Terriglobia bacterium]